MEQPKQFNKKGSRLETLKVKVSQTKNGQYRITLPQMIARQIGIVQGSVMEYKILSDNKIGICKSEKENDDKTG